MRVWVGLLALGLVAGCSLFEEEERLSGERISLRPATPGPDSGRAEAAPLPPAASLADWTQTNGNSGHNSGHLAGPSGLNPAWSADAGEGTSGDSALTAAPIVVGGVVYTLDAAATVSAFDASGGGVRWRADLAPEGEGGEEGFGGGLAADGGRIYATTGFGEVIALDTGGAVIWRQSLGAPFRAGPAAAGGLVLAVTRDNRAFAFDGATGEVRWRLAGVSSDAGLLGGAAPALVQGLAVIPYGSGELVGVDPGSGRRIWTVILSGGRRGLARAAISDVTGDPVVVGPYVVAANQSGRMVAVDGRTGRRVWTRTIGATRPIWASGPALFVVSDEARLLRLDTATGQTVWEVELPAFEDMEDREDPITYSGPVLVGGRVLVTDSIGQLHDHDAVSGVGATRDLGGAGADTGIVVAGGTAFVLDDDATLRAYR